MVLSVISYDKFFICFGLIDKLNIHFIQFKVLKCSLCYFYAKESNCKGDDVFED
jgi:hypothetical protein